MVTKNKNTKNQQNYELKSRNLQKIELFSLREIESSNIVTRKFTGRTTDNSLVYIVTFSS